MFIDFFVEIVTSSETFILKGLISVCSSEEFPGPHQVSSNVGKGGTAIKILNTTLMKTINTHVSTIRFEDIIFVTLAAKNFYLLKLSNIFVLFTARSGRLVCVN